MRVLLLLLVCYGIGVESSLFAIGPPAAPASFSFDRALETYSGGVEYHLSDNNSRPAFDATQSRLSDDRNVNANNFHQRPVAVDYPVNGVPGSYSWLTDPKFQHLMPLAGDDYKVLRNVKDYGAKGDGRTDDSQAIENAIKEGGRCGGGCNATSTLGAIIYFPPGIYAISRPIQQYYYTSFIGDPSDIPRITATNNFEGIALIDMDVYIPDGNGANWYINQNNFYRQMRNFVLDLSNMPNIVKEGPSINGNNNLPVGIHYQTAQMCPLQNIEFWMPTGTDSRHVGIFQENGSGGFASDLRFIGGSIGWIAGSQQFTARNIEFTNCRTAVYMIWDWGWNWKDIKVTGSEVAFDLSELSPKPDPGTGRYQGTASMNLIDSEFSNIYGVVVKIHNKPQYYTSLLLDNFKLDAVKSIVATRDGKVFLRSNLAPGQQWVLGWIFDDKNPNGTYAYRPIERGARKSKNLLSSSGTVFTRSKPSYEDPSKSHILNILDFQVDNSGQLDQASLNTQSINFALQVAAANNSVLAFPAGIYLVDDTLHVPPGSRITGALWSQIMAIGEKFADPSVPKALVQVGNPGERGVVEISDLTFTTHGNTAGAVLMEWNIKESFQGSAAIWDTVFRVGGADGSALGLAECPWTTAYDGSTSCMGSTMMLHVTSKSSIYMENLWLWVADHDIEDPSQTRVNVYGARGVLIESKGPSWVYSVSNEHSTLYNWNVYDAKDLYLAQIQSETPYFQGGQLVASKPYFPGDSIFPGDPKFGHCLVSKNKATKKPSLSSTSSRRKKSIDTCQESWGLRIVNSSSIWLYGAGHYSFFLDYKDTCAKADGVCQERIIDTSYSGNVHMFNIYTVGSKEVISPQGLSFNSTNRDRVLKGFSTAIAAWTMLSDPSAALLGGSRDNIPFTQTTQTSSDTASDSSGNLHPTCQSLEPSAYQAFQCTDYEPGWSNASAGTEWVISGGPQRWCEVMSMLKTSTRAPDGTYIPKHANGSLSVDIAAYLGYSGYKYFKCGTAAPSCNTVVSCKDFTKGNTDSAAVSIVNTLVVISEFFKAIDALLLQIGNDAGPKADSFRSDFSPVAEDKDASTLKIVADIVGFGFLFVSHGVWHNAAKLSLGNFGKSWGQREAKKAGDEAHDNVIEQYRKSNPDRKSDSEIADLAKQAREKVEKATSDDLNKRVGGYGDTARDFVNTMVSASQTIFKDKLESSASSAAAPWKIFESLSKTVANMREGFDIQKSALLDGSLNHLDLLDQAVQSGAFAWSLPANEIFTAPKNISSTIQNVIFEATLPKVWGLDTFRWPFILMEPLRSASNIASSNKHVWASTSGGALQDITRPLETDFSDAIVDDASSGKTFYLLESHDCETPRTVREGNEAPADGHVINRIPADILLDKTRNNTFIPPAHQSQSLSKRSKTTYDASSFPGSKMICLDPSKEGALRMLPGIDKLENYGLSPEILVTSAFGVFSGNKNQNLDPQNRLKSLQALATAQIGRWDDTWADPKSWMRIPGTFSVPICSYDVWRVNHKNYGLAHGNDKKRAPPCPLYPCCPLELFPRESWTD